MESLPPLATSSREQPCVLCGQQHFELLYELDRHNRPLNTVICTTCGLVSHEAIATDEALHAYYRTEYREQYHNAFRPNPHHVLRAWELGGKLVEKLRQYAPQGGRFFEVGAGIGATVKQFELAGMKAAGVEPHDGYRTYGRTKLRAALEPGVLNDLEPSPWYDLIIVHHVLEHLPEPVEALTRVRQMLRLNGLAYVEVPNLTGPHAAPGKQFHEAHIYNFTPQSLTAVAAAAGLTVKKSFTNASHENIGLLLEASHGGEGGFDYLENYQFTRLTMLRHNRITYYSRPRYLVNRVRRALAQFADRLNAEQRLAPILRACAADKVQDTTRRVA